MSGLWEEREAQVSGPPIHRDLLWEGTLTLSLPHLSGWGSTQDPLSWYMLGHTGVCTVQSFTLKLQAELPALSLCVPSLCRRSRNAHTAIPESPQRRSPASCPTWEFHTQLQPYDQLHRSPLDRRIPFQPMASES